MRVFIASKQSPEAEAYSRNLVSEAESLGIEPVKSPEEAESIIVVGGDGTLLKYVKLGLPVLGIKFGRRSKLLEVEPEQGESAIKRIVKGDYVIDEYPLLEAQVRDRRALIFNEIALVFDGAETVVGSISFGSEKINFEGDGIIVSTPQGSWAWGFSASGVIVHKNVNAIEVTFMNPIVPLGLKTLILPLEELVVKLEDKGRDQRSKVLVDGEILDYFSKTGEGFTVRKSDRRAKLVRFREPLEILKPWK